MLLAWSTTSAILTLTVTCVVNASVHCSGPASVSGISVDSKARAADLLKPSRLCEARVWRDKGVQFDVSSASSICFVNDCWSEMEVYGPNKFTVANSSAFNIQGVANSFEIRGFTMGSNANVHVASSVQWVTKGTVSLGDKSNVTIWAHSQVMSEADGVLEIGPYGTLHMEERSALRLPAGTKLRFSDAMPAAQLTIKSNTQLSLIPGTTCVVVGPVAALDSFQVLQWGAGNAAPNVDCFSSCTCDN